MIVTIVASGPNVGDLEHRPDSRCTSGSSVEDALPRVDRLAVRKEWRRNRGERGQSVPVGSKVEGQESLADALDEVGVRTLSGLEKIVFGISPTTGVGLLFLQVARRPGDNYHRPDESASSMSIPVSLPSSGIVS